MRQRYLKLVQIRYIHMGEKSFTNVPFAEQFRGSMGGRNHFENLKLDHKCKEPFRKRKRKRRERNHFEKKQHIKVQVFGVKRFLLGCFF